MGTYWNTPACHRATVAVDTPRPFIDPVPHFQNVYASSAAGELLEYTRLPDGSWVAVDLTVLSGGQRIALSPRPVVEPVTANQAVYAETPADHSIEFIRLPSGAWTDRDLFPNGGQPQVNGSPVPFTDGATPTLFVRSSRAIVEFSRKPDGNWTWAFLPGPPIGGDPAPFVDPVTHLLNVYYSNSVGAL